jgi:hypothetical protein
MVRFVQSGNTSTGDEKSNLAQHVQPIIKLSPDQSSRYPLQYSSPRRLPRYLLSFFFLRKKKLKGIQGKAKGRAN